MRRVLSSIGIGGATVDTVLPKTELQPGETVEVDVELSGGDASQEIAGIHFVLKTRVESNGDVDEHVLGEFGVEEPISLDPGEERTIPADVEIPLWTPVTTSGVSVWLETRLDIDWARDPTDEDRIEVVPDEYLSAMFAAVDELGFDLGGSTLDEIPYVDDRPIAQKFVFRPADDRFRSVLDTMEISVMPRSEDLRVFVEYDLVDEVADEYDLDFDRQEVSLTFRRADVDAIRRHVESSIDQHT